MTAKPAVERSARALVWLTTFVWLGLLITGVWLYFFYSPAAAFENSFISEGFAEQLARSRRIQQVHRLLAIPAVVLPLILAALQFAQSAVRRAMAAVAAVVIAGAASFSGFQLPWDQLAPQNASVGDNIRGYSSIFGDNAQSVLIDGVEVSPQTVMVWLLIHTIVLPLLILAVIALGWRRRSS